VPPNSSPCRRGSSPPIPSRRSPAGRLSAWTRSIWTRGYVTSAPAGAALNCATRSPSTYAKPRDWTELASLSRGAQIGGATARDNSGRDGHRLTRGRQRSYLARLCSIRGLPHVEGGRPSCECRASTDACFHELSGAWPSGAARDLTAVSTEAGTEAEGGGSGPDPRQSGSAHAKMEPDGVRSGTAQMPARSARLPS